MLSLHLIISSFALFQRCKGPFLLGFLICQEVLCDPRCTPYLHKRLKNRKFIGLTRFWTLKSAKLELIGIKEK
jgi:hypothetical protein